MQRRVSNAFNKAMLNQISMAAPFKTFNPIKQLSRLSDNDVPNAPPAC